MTTALRALLRDQPLSPGKVSLAWSAAVGRAIDRVTNVALDSDGALRVTAADPHWVRELRRSRLLITTRLNQLLGDGVVKRIEVSSRTAPREKQSHARVGHR
jgi:predicted nucleic acid-binding Zn ribbon protein